MLDLLDAGQPVMTPKICRAELLDIALTELIPAGLVEDFEDYKDTLDVTIDSKDPNRLNFICHPEHGESVARSGRSHPVQTLRSQHGKYSGYGGDSY